ncbi:hypothetical protein CLIB1444_06S05908 [[Candida] jaroonii]|uniref:Uncharacterized protein n=1 Tax=[Candida] jaroonii TaxID=467808 RepID=A0ACA9Y980_9ASCO|nr:hypothetical protein CLIB1444_06S05908 [[Candida] jaroonii]
MKKISKNSRAARRATVESEEAKELAKVEKNNNDIKKSIIRTTILNENLLNKKIEKKKSKKLNNSIKHKIEKNTKLQGVLDTKINQSIERHKFVSTKRKMDWDKINKEIKDEVVDVPEVEDKNNKFAILGEEEA